MRDKINFRGIKILNEGKDLEWLLSLPENVVDAVENTNLLSLCGGVLGAGTKESIAFAVINDKFNHGKKVDKNGCVGYLCARVCQTNHYPKPKYDIAFWSQGQGAFFADPVATCKTREDACEVVETIIGAKNPEEIGKRIADLKAKKAEGASER